MALGLGILNSLLTSIRLREISISPFQFFSLDNDPTQNFASNKVSNILAQLFLEILHLENKGRRYETSRLRQTMMRFRDRLNILRDSR